MCSSWVCFSSTAVQLTPKQTASALTGAVGEWCQGQSKSIVPFSHQCIYSSTKLHYRRSMMRTRPQSRWLNGSRQQKQWWWPQTAHLCILFSDKGKGFSNAHTGIQPYLAAQEEVTYGADETPICTQGSSGGTTWQHLGSRIPLKDSDTNLELSNTRTTPGQQSSLSNRGRATALTHLVEAVCKGRETAVLSTDNKLLAFLPIKHWFLSNSTETADTCCFFELKQAFFPSLVMFV